MESLKFFYINYKGVGSYREVLDPHFYFGTSEYHGKKPQWFIRAYDKDKQDFRDFAVKDIVEFN